ncbi:MAG: nitrile hydratase accessory protein [Steroidobacteraceae bacterium]
MSRPDPTLQSRALAGLPHLSRDENGPVFAEPWQAESFALTVLLSTQGYFTWKEWGAALADELQADAQLGHSDDGSRYYDCWLTTLERLAVDKRLTDAPALRARKEAWTDAYRGTRHGAPVHLNADTA